MAMSILYQCMLEVVFYLTGALRRVKAALSRCREEDLLDFKLLELLRTTETFEVGSHFDLGDKTKTLEHEGESYELK